MSEASGQRWDLSPRDEEALDALVLAGWELERVPGALRERAQGVMQLLKVLETPAPMLEAQSSDRAERVIREVTEIAGTGARDSSATELSAEDQEAIDQYVLAGYQLDKVSSSLHARAARAHMIGEALTQVACDTSGSQLRIERAMQAVARARSAAPLEAPSSRSGARLTDMLSVAAVLLMGVGALWPIASAVRSQSGKSGCQSHLRDIAGAFGQYGNDFRDQLPMASASLGGSSWWDVGQDVSRSNSANFFTLPREGYVALESTACSGNPHAVRDMKQLGEGARDWGALEQVSYSYYVMFGDARPRWQSQPQEVVLADRSPIVLAASRGKSVGWTENSPNHHGQGQHALKFDGSAGWYESPMIQEDNIWLPANVEVAFQTLDREFARIRDELVKSGAKGTFTVTGQVQLPSRESAAATRGLTGVETPSGPEDSFVGP